MKFTRITESQKSKMKLDTLRYNSYTMSEENDPDFFEKKSNRFELEFYTTDDGKEPVADFLDSLDHKMNAKRISLMELLEERGTELREPYSASLGDGIFELRCKLGSNITRALYFFYVGNHINWLIKKTQKTKAPEIRLAKKRRKDWLSRHMKGDVDNKTKR